MGNGICASRGAVVVLVVLLVAGSAGCGLFSRSKPKPPEAAAPAPAPAAAPASPAPPPPVVPPAAPVPAPRPAGGRIADEGILGALVQGRTTKAEVRERFGIPQEVVVSPGVETFIYYRDRTSGLISRTTERVEMLTIRFDANGVLRDFEYRYSGK